MKRIHLLGLVIAFAAVPLSFAQTDREGAKDYPGIARMPGYYIDNYEDIQFDSISFQVTTNGKSTEQKIEGHTIKIGYYLKEGATATSMLQVIRNYQNAARAAGGQVLDDTKGGNWYNTTLRLNQSGREIWILVEVRNGSHVLSIVERQPVQQDAARDAAGKRINSGAR
jgi:hypothetical protein